MTIKDSAQEYTYIPVIKKALTTGTSGISNKLAQTGKRKKKKGRWKNTKQIGSTEIMSGLECKGHSRPRRDF